MGSGKILFTAVQIARTPRLIQGKCRVRSLKSLIFGGNGF